MKDLHNMSWGGQWSSQYDAANQDEYGWVPIVLGLIAVAGGGGYMAYESARVAEEVHTDSIEIRDMVRAERAKSDQHLESWRDERVQSAFLNAPANNTEAALMSAFWYFRAARQAAQQVGYTERAPVLLELGDDVMGVVHTPDGLLKNDDRTNMIEQFFYNAATHVGDIDIGMRIAIQDLANPRAIEQRRHLSQTLGNPRWMATQWAVQSADDVKQFTQNPLSFIDDLKRVWAEYKWWVIGLGGGYILLSAAMSAKQAQRRKRSRAARQSAPPARPERKSLTEIRGGA